MPEFSDIQKIIGPNPTTDDTIRGLRFVISAEYEAVHMYTKFAELVSDEEVEKVLEDIAKEELVHAGEFLKLLFKLYKEEPSLYDKGRQEVEEIVSEWNTITSHILGE